MNIALSFLLLMGLYASYSLYCLAVNLRIAKEIGIPLVTIPVDPENPLWMLLGNRVASIIRYISGESHFTRFSIRGWAYHDKNRAAIELGDHFAVVTPRKVWLYVCNAETFNEVVRRSSDFTRPLELYGLLNVFGRNVATVEGSEWQRQRKLTSGPFNEAHCKLVWAESICQAHDVLMLWTSQENPVTHTAKHVRTLSLHVLTSAGFGKFYPFKKGGELPKSGRYFNYTDALACILDNIVLIFVVGPAVLKSPFLPRPLSKVGHAIVDFQAYLREIYDDEVRSMKEGRQASVSIMASLVRATTQTETDGSTEDDQVSWAARDTTSSLSESDIYGNAFLYNLAGHDTTAATLSWAIYLLAANPEVQEWIGEEISVIHTSGEASIYEYRETFPRMKRCLAIMLEVLRLYNPLPGILKSTKEKTLPLNLRSKTIKVPAGARVMLHTPAIHTHPNYWGSDSLEWRPQRWITTPSRNISHLENEILIKPPQGTYAPWSGGPRICPGKKFGQVEFVAVMATLFKDYRVEPIAKQSENMQTARARVLAAVNNSDMVVLLQMAHPEVISLRWVKKGFKSDDIANIRSTPAL